MGKRKLTEYRKKYLIFRISERRRQVKLQAIAYKGGECSRCKYKGCPGAMVFHHLDPAQKDYGFSNKGIYRPFEKVKPELDKCVLLCQNCHCEIHHEMSEKVRLEKQAELKLLKSK